MPGMSEGQRTLLRRLSAIERAASEARRVGVVVTTEDPGDGGAKQRRFRNLLESHGRRVYTLILSDLSPPRFGNFVDLGAFVLLDSPGFLFHPDTDVGAYHAPLLTPLEALVAFAGVDLWEAVGECQARGDAVEALCGGWEEAAAGRGGDGAEGGSASSSVVVGAAMEASLLEDRKEEMRAVAAGVGSASKSFWGLEVDGVGDDEDEDGERRQGAEGRAAPQTELLEGQHGRARWYEKDGSGEVERAGVEHTHAHVEMVERMREQDTTW